MRMARAAVADLVMELGDAAPPERLVAALASALGDPSLTLLTWSPAFRAYLDSGGTPIEPEGDPAGRATTYLEHAGRRIGVILHDRSRSEDPGLVAAVAAAVRLAVDNERLTAEVRSQLDEVRASRARIVQASDAERRRVERNLHDGAQQRLVALSLALRRAQAQLPEHAAPQARAILANASEQLAAAMTELRELAKGIHPAILTEAGLGAALRALANESPVAAAVRIQVPEELSEDVSAAAYFVAAEALTNVAKYASAGNVELIVEADGDVLRVEIIDDGVGGADAEAGSGLRGLADRVAALGGRLDVRSPVGSGTHVVARLPLTGAVEIG
jgi:signal transduction histidine kinase